MRAYDKNLLRKDEAIFFLAFIMYITSIAVERTTFAMELPINTERLLKLIRYGSYLLFCIKFSMTCIEDVCEKRQILMTATAVLIAAIIVFTNNKSLLMASFVFFAALRMDMRRVLTAYEIVIAGLLLLNILFSLMGISTNYLFDATTRQRLGLGYNWTTVAPITYMFLVFGYLYLRGDNARVLEYMLLLAVAVWFFLQTDTKFAFAVTVAYILDVFSNRYIIRKPWFTVRSIGKCNLLIPLLIAVASIALYFLYVPDSEKWQTLNGILSNRLSYGYNAINNYKINLFGQKIEWIGHSIEQELAEKVHSDDFLDSAYIRNLYLYGIVGLALILSVYILGIYKSVKYGDWHMVTIYIFILLFCVFEFWIDKVDINPYTVLAVTEFVPKHENSSIRFQYRPISAYS